MRGKFTGLQKSSGVTWSQSRNNEEGRRMNYCPHCATNGGHSSDRLDHSKRQRPSAEFTCTIARLPLCLVNQVPVSCYCLPTHTHISGHVRIHIHTGHTSNPHARTHKHARTHARTHTHTHTHARRHAHTQTRTHTHAQTQLYTYRHRYGRMHVVCVSGVCMCVRVCECVCVCLCV